MKLITLPETDSTNTWLKSHRKELDSGDAVTALRQTAGRGRMGHTWEGDSGMLPLSVLLRNPPYPQTVTLNVSIAVCRVLEGLFDNPPQLMIKWPNDIILDSRKICGILCESVTDSSSMDIICGVGVNLCQSDEYFAAAALPHGGSLLTLTELNPDREQLAVKLSAAIAEHCKNGFADYYDKYKRRCINLGKTVRLIQNGQERTAEAVDISHEGHLICRDESGIFEVSSGEVSVRGLYGYV